MLSYTILLILGAFGAGFVCGVLATIFGALAAAPMEDAPE